MKCNKLVSLGAVATSLLVSGIAHAAPAQGLAGTTIELQVQDEQQTQASSHTYSYGSGLNDLNVNSPVLCANVSTPTQTLLKFRPRFGNFVFGQFNDFDPGDFGPAVNGISLLNYVTPNKTLVIGGDGSLVCYVLDGTGLRKPTNGLFNDGFDLVGYDATVSITVAELPTVPNKFKYLYYVDVAIPVVNQPRSFVLRDGFDDNEFVRQNGTWCLTQANDQSQCSGTSGGGNIDVAINLNAGQSFSRRFIVNRKTEDLILPSQPLVYAALFGPPALGETRLDNNVAYGDSLTDNLPPVFDTLPSLAAITEGGSLLGQQFNITDETPEGGSAFLSATATINFGSTVLSPPVTCVDGAGYVPPTPPVHKQCSFDITPPANFAGTAQVTLRAIDPAGVFATRALSLVVNSGDNDAPEFRFSERGAIPELTCTWSQQPLPQACFGVYPSFVQNMYPGPADAMDELATQSVFINLWPTSSFNGGNVNCTAEAGSPQIFSFNQNPFLTQETVVHPLSWRLNYGMIGPSAVGSALCFIAVIDSGAPIAWPHRYFRIISQP